MKTKIIFFMTLICMVIMTIGCIESPETEVLPIHTPIPDVSTLAPHASKTTAIPTDISVEQFIDKYIEATDIFFYDSYEQELNANESENLAVEYYNSDQFDKASAESHKASELYLIARERNLESEKLFEEVYEIAPTEHYKELCTLYISASQSGVKCMGYMSSVMGYMERACEYYERGDYIAGDKEIDEATRKTILYNIETETFNEIIEKIYEIDRR